MSHYTLRSGQRTVTQSVYCPICRTRRVCHPAEAHLPFMPLRMLCCSPVHVDQQCTRIKQAVLSGKVDELCILLLLLALLLPSFALAAPRAKPKPPPLPYSATDRQCADLGILARAISVDRDHGVPLSTTNARIRVIVRHQWAQYPAIIPEMTQQTLKLAWMLYDTPGFPAELAARGAEVGCLHPQAMQGPHEQQPALWR